MLSNCLWKSLSEANPKMTSTIIVKCTKCSGYMLCTKTQKTKRCPYCGANVNLQRAQRVAAANTVFEASEILKKLKNERGFDRKP
jgi:acetyl-CoA carboxylase beta subunit